MRESNNGINSAIHNGKLEKKIYYEELLVDEELEEVLSDYTSNIIVYNDDQNTFEWVIESFVDVLKHS